MSIHAIGWALKRASIRSSEKFVLVCLANYADENGECYPSIAALEAATCQDRKTIISNLARLVDSGFIVDTGKRVGSTGSIPVYQLLAHRPGSNAESGTSTGNGTVSKEGAKQSQISREGVPVFPGSSPENGTRIHQDTKGNQPQRESDPANPSTPKAPRSTKQRERNSQEEFPARPEWLPAEQWDGFVEFRRKKKAPLTPRAMALTFKELDRLRAEGQDVGAVLDQSVMRGWTGVFAVHAQRGPAASQESMGSALSRNML